MEEFIDDNMSDGLYNAFCDGSIDTSDMSDGFQDVSKETPSSIFDGGFNPSDVDFSYLPEETSEDSFDDDDSVGISNTYYDDGEISYTNYQEDIDNSITDNVNLDGSNAQNVSFGSKYSVEEIQNLKSDVEKAQYEMQCRKNEVHNWEAKLSINDTKEHRAKGDYENAVKHLNDAKSIYNNAASRYNDAVSKYNNTK